MHQSDRPPAAAAAEKDTGLAGWDFGTWVGVVVAAMDLVDIARLGEDCTPLPAVEPESWEILRCLIRVGPEPVQHLELLCYESFAAGRST